MTEHVENAADTETDAKKAKKPADKELVALKRIGAILASLSDGAKRRVLGYYSDRSVAV